ncbi:xanthine dehydrogenase accessory protein XdhC [Maribius pontilimi]|uniref:Xanthine dehydrogenase accessory protein XdhC n=1 Tax=Palleronia pontilimi TaxID=1964209 RepID=A0A934MC38_9RHOB|nr:xanthine dehydrogenase accessory protein XdhC [Palleronia pontilimi]MBJ3762363.1 xanthine dehydrogenase accessory protein XdhC [Palleronia pontilimi]
MSDPVIYVEIVAARGSSPREVGTAMQVGATHVAGTIGGGALEHRAIAEARALLDAGGDGRVLTLPLGPALGQCCGGSVSLLFTRDRREIDTSPPVVHPVTEDRGPPRPLWLWGAGHVGRAVVRACPPAAHAITWVDDAADRFPSCVPDRVDVVVARNMARLAASAPQDAQHLIFTYSHEIDLALCAALLDRGAAGIGLIGSDTKWRRFRNRLEALGLDPRAITCPIGDKSLGKHPDAIARGVVARLASEREVSA